MALNLNYEPEVLVEDITALSEEEWKKYRTLGIGGSDAAAVCGISPWKTARDLYEEKVHKQVTGDEADGWVAKEIGKRLEELVVQIYMRQTRLQPYAVRKMFRHPLYPFMIADCDYFVMINGKIYAVECKTSFSFRQEEWEDGNIPPHYALQGRHYMAVANVDGVIFLCLHGNNEVSLIKRRLERDLEQEEELIRQEKYFWEKCVALRKPPKYTESGNLVLKSIRNRLGFHKGEKVELPKAYAANAQSYLELKKQKEELERQVRKVDEQMKLAYAPIQEAMGGAEEGVLAADGAQYRIGYTKRTVTSINKESLEVLQLLQPEIYQEYAKTNISRIFYIKQDKAS